MSLRLFYRLALLLAVAAALLTGAVWWWTRDLPAPMLNQDYRTLKDVAQSTRGTVMAPQGPAVDYVLPAAASSLRITTNANLRDLHEARRMRQADPQRRWHYAIEIEEVDAGGSSRKRTHHFSRDLREVELPNAGRGTGSFYLQRDASSPIAAAVLRLDFAGSSRPARIRLRLVSSDPEVTDVLVRVAIPEPVSQRTAENAWRRLSDEQQLRLAGGNLFPPNLLLEQERVNVMASRWRPLGPSGEFVGRDIYLLDLPDRGAVIEPAQAPVRMAGPDRRVVVQLPEKGARVRIALEPLRQDSAYPAEVTIRWAGHSAFQRSVTRHGWRGGNFVVESDFGGGWLEISASVHAAVRVTLSSAQDAPELTLPVRFLRAWDTRPNEPVEFLASHAGSEPTPLRLVLRRMGVQGRPFATTPVDVELVNADGRVLRKLVVSMRPLVDSLYDAPWPEIAGDRLSDPLEAFFRLPADVAFVRVNAADPVLVNAYSRPADLARAVRTPEDASEPEAAQSAIPGWFPLQPQQAEARILNNANRLLTVQPRLPDDRPEVAAGIYQWESFDPVNEGAARVFLAPREPGVPDRIDGIAGTFRALPTKDAVAFVAEPGRSAVTARLAWVAGSACSFRYSVALDGQPWASGAASGIAGEVVLPAFPPGVHQLKIEADASVRWYASHLQSDDPWVKRLAFRFDKPLRFDVDRTTSEEEFLTVRLFRPAGATGRVRVRVRIDAPPLADPIGPYPGWLFTQRVHDVRPSGEFALPVAETGGEKSDAGQPFFVPFPKDAPRGRYRITLVPEGGPSWVSTSRITPGGRAKPTLILESKRNGE